MPRRNRYKPRKDGLYEAKVQIGHKPDGTPNRVSVYAQTSKDLETQVDDIKHQINRKEYYKDKSITLGDYANDWFDAYKSTKSPSTKALYNNILNNHLLELSAFPLCDITTMDIQRLINSRSDRQRICEQIRSTLNQVFESAIDDDIITKNPCRRVTTPQAPKSTKRALTDLEISALKKASFSDKERAFVYILYACGLRRGEALALTKSDVDFNDNKIIVCKALSRDKSRHIIKQPKTASGYRAINMPSFLTDYLKEYVQGIDDVLFPNRDGQVMSLTSYRRMWKSIISKMNIAAGGDDENKIIDNLTAHIFRHNYCTLLYYSDISLKKACELLGHSNTRMIMEVYSHLDERKEKTQDKIEKTISL